MAGRRGDEPEWANLTNSRRRSELQSASSHFLRWCCSRPSWSPRRICLRPRARSSADRPIPTQNRAARRICTACAASSVARLASAPLRPAAPQAPLPALASPYASPGLQRPKSRGAPDRNSDSPRADHPRVSERTTGLLGLAFHFSRGLCHSSQQQALAFRLPNTPLHSRGEQPPLHPRKAAERRVGPGLWSYVMRISCHRGSALGRALLSTSMLAAIAASGCASSAFGQTAAPDSGAINLPPVIVFAPNGATSSPAGASTTLQDLAPERATTSDTASLAQRRAWRRGL